ncbi:hypothetical protein V1511DRAFT_243879 [Dipodascopsis uninucleata]
MEENPCIICLQALPTRLRDQNPDSDVPQGSLFENSGGLEGEQQLTDEDSENVYDGTNEVACLIPCRHSLHNSCLKLWIEQATSCPICRTTFNTVEVSHFLNGSTVSTYDVETKVQTAEFVDPGENDLEIPYEEETPCLICDFGGREDELLLCDACDAPYHASCLGFDGVPIEDWYCPCCVDNHRVTEDIMRQARSRTSASRRLQSRRRRTANVYRGRQSRQWNRAWQTVWDRLNRDLDDGTDSDGVLHNEFDEDEVVREIDGSRTRRRHATRSSSLARRRRTRREVEENRMWILRLQVAESSGSSSRFRDTASLLFQSENNTDEAKLESQENIESWHMLQRALELEESESARSSAAEASASTSGHNRTQRSQPRLFSNSDESNVVSINHDSKRLVDSSESHNESDDGNVRKFKRPRASQRKSQDDARQDITSNGSIISTTNSTELRATNSISDSGPSLMRSLLEDIRKPTSPIAESSFSLINRSFTGETSLPTPGPGSPHNGPTTAGNGNGVGGQTVSRSPSASPVVLPSSASFPPSPPADMKCPMLSPPMHPTLFSSPLSRPHDNESRSLSPSRKTSLVRPFVPSDSFSDGSLSDEGPVERGRNSHRQRQLTLEQKTEIQEIVRSILRPLYRSGRVSKDSYTVINKKVSHILYSVALEENRTEESSSPLLSSSITSEQQKTRWSELARTHVNLELSQSSSST